MTQDPSSRAARGLAVRAVILLAVFALAHLAGLRQFLPLLCGSPAPGDYPRVVQALACGTYLAAYFCAVLVAPVFVLAAGLLALKSRGASG